MRRFLVAVMAFTAGAAAVGIATLPRSGVAQQETRPADAQPQPFNPQLGALMNMIVQPRHAKLGLAGQQENWALAGYMFTQLKAGFGVVGRAVPRYKGLPVPDLIEAALDQQWPVLDFAIKAGEPRQFLEAYGKLTQGCNNCHATADHAFVVIKIPDPAMAAAWPNQEFKPAAR